MNGTQYANIWLFTFNYFYSWNGCSNQASAMSVNGNKTVSWCRGLPFHQPGIAAGQRAQPTNKCWLIIPRKLAVCHHLQVLDYLACPLGVSWDRWLVLTQLCTYISRGGLAWMTRLCCRAAPFMLRCPCPVQVHEGDWERISVLVCAETGETQQLSYSQHDWWEIRAADNATYETVNGTAHPVAYAGLESHANYFDGGRALASLAAVAGWAALGGWAAGGPGWLGGHWSC